MLRPFKCPDVAMRLTWALHREYAKHQPNAVGTTARFVIGAPGAKRDGVLAVKGGGENPLSLAGKGYAGGLGRKVAKSAPQASRPLRPAGALRPSPPTPLLPAVKEKLALETFRGVLKGEFLDTSDRNPAPLPIQPCR
jgi:hypothetical protein